MFVTPWIVSNIRKEKYRPDTTSTTTTSAVNVCHAQAAPPGFRNEVEWRALVED